MDMTLKQLFDCRRGKNIPADFANENIDYRAALRDELKGLCGTPNLFRRNSGRDCSRRAAQAGSGTNWYVCGSSSIWQQRPCYL